ncbi:MAG: hypothetical protein P8X81_11840 [Woeseiaceae bacterium]|jgi:hypothetical protein
MRITIVALSALSWMFFNTGAFAQASCDTGTPAENMPEEFSQFAFIIGDFDINYRRMTEHGWSEPLGHARWNGRYALDGRAIMDWWYEEGEDGAALHGEF